MGSWGCFVYFATAGKGIWQNMLKIKVFTAAFHGKNKRKRQNRQKAALKNSQSAKNGGINENNKILH